METQHKIDLGKYFDDKTCFTYLVYQIVGYVSLNLLFMALYFRQPDSVSFVSSSIESIADKIPVIVKSASLALEGGNAERARDIIHIYGFNWLSFILLAPAFLLTNMYAARAHYKIHAPKVLQAAEFGALPRNPGLGYMALAVLSALCAWGTFDWFYHDEFQKFGRPCGLTKNCVHIKNIDFLRLLLFASAQLLFTFGLIVLSAEAFLLHKAFLRTKGLL